MPDDLALWDGFSAIVGTTGAGKSYTARGVVERFLHQRRRTCIIDPTGVWWGLRTMSDGGPGFPVVIFGGDHADVPITKDSGAALGALIGGGGKVEASIIDVSDFSTAQRTHFLTEFFEALYNVNRAPLHLVLDEADEMAPQSTLPEARRLLGTVDRIVRRGRARGFRPMMITQRPAVLHKNVLSQIQTLVAMCLVSPQDRGAINDWVKGNADTDVARAVMDSLPQLATGEGWIWSPRLSVLERKTFPEIATLDSSRTPEHGEAVATLRPIATVDVVALRAALAPAQEPKVGVKAAGGVGATDVAAAEQRGYARGYAAGAREGASAGWMIAVARYREYMRDNLMLNFRVEPTDDDHRDIGLCILDPAVPISPEPKYARQTGARVDTVKVAKGTTKPAASPSALNSAASKMLAVLDTNPPVRRSWQQVATLAGLKARGGHFNGGKRVLIDQGLVLIEGDLVSIAQPSDGATAPVSNPAAMVELWADALTGGAPRVMRALFNAGGRATRKNVAEMLGLKPSGGHWNGAWKELRDNGIVTVEGDVATLTELFQPGSARDAG